MIFYFYFLKNKNIIFKKLEHDFILFYFIKKYFFIHKNQR